MRKQITKSTFHLTPEDKEILLTFGEGERSFAQIEEAASSMYTSYTLVDQSGKSTRISRKTAIELLGRKIYLSGLDRSAFHYSAVRETPNGEKVYFDSTRYFKG